MRAFVILAILLAALLLPVVFAIVELVAEIVLAATRFTAPRIRRARSAAHRALLPLRAPPAFA